MTDKATTLLKAYGGRMTNKAHITDIDVLADAEHEAALASGTGSDKLDRLKELARRQIDLEDEIQALNQQLAERQKELTQLATKDLPLAFSSLGLTHIGVGNIEVRVENGLNARLPKADEDPTARAWALNWLTENKHSGVIKVSLEVSFKRGQFQLAKAIAEDIEREFKVPVAVNESVHYQTYLALMKELVFKKQQAIPADKLGVYQYSYTVVIR